MGLQAQVDARALRRENDHVDEGCMLGGEAIQTGFCLVTKRMDTGSPWILANNPRSRYWETKPANSETGESGHTGNKYYELSSLVRASTAAPFYFDPEWLQIVEADESGKGGQRGLFVDGGVTPHNSPSLVLFLLAILNAYKLNWETGTDKLTIVSIGTGSHRDRVVPDDLGMGRTTKLAIRALTSLMNDAQTFALTQMQYLGNSLTPWWIDSELGTLAGESPPHGKLFQFMRYDVRLELKWIEAELGDEVEKKFGRKLTETDIIRMRSMDDPTIIEDIYELAKIAAEKQVKAEHWVGSLATWCGGRRPAAAARQLKPQAADRSAASRLWTAYLKALSVALSRFRSHLVRISNPPPK